MVERKWLTITKWPATSPDVILTDVIPLWEHILNECEFQSPNHMPHSPKITVTTTSCLFQPSQRLLGAGCVHYFRLNVHHPGNHSVLHVAIVDADLLSKQKMQAWKYMNWDMETDSYSNWCTNTTSTNFSVQHFKLHVNGECSVNPDI